MLPHISVCVCTFKRPRFLGRLLGELERQQTEGLFTFSAVVADNDSDESARPVVSEFTATSRFPVVYCVEPEQNIALARNAALGKACGDYVAFIDDDEFPESRWLLNLFNACRDYGVDGALGPVKPYFEATPPPWVIKGKFYERTCYDTGHFIEWRQGRTGNALLKRQIFDSIGPAFNPEFLTGEDQDFFRRMIHEKGHVFVWCGEAVAYEIVPPIRWRRSFILRRALLRGMVSLRHPNVGLSDTVKSLVAASGYGMLLPIYLLLGHHVFMRHLEKLTWHIGKLVAVIGLRPLKEKYVTE